MPFVVIFIVITNTVFLFEFYSTFCAGFGADDRMKGTNNKTDLAGEREYNESMRLHCPLSLLCHRSFWVLGRYSSFWVVWVNHDVSYFRVGAAGSFSEDAVAF